MTIAQVGSLGTAAMGTTTASPTFAQATTAGNFCVCWCACGSGASLTLSGVSGWTLLVANASGTIYYKENCGAGETAPTVNGTVFTVGALAEFSGVATASSLDQSANNIGTSSPAVSSTAGADVSGGELLLSVTSYVYTMAATKTTSHAFNNGATAIADASWNNDATSTASHYRFAYGITTGNSAADQITDTFTTTSISTRAMKLGSFLVAAVAATAATNIGHAHLRTIGPVLAPRSS